MRRPRNLILPLIALAALGMAMGILFGYLGRLHPAFDTFSHFRLHLAALLACAGLVLAAARWRIGGAVALAGALATIATTLFPATLGLPAPAYAQTGVVEGARYRLLQINVLYDNPSPEKVLSLIGRTAPDVVTLDEVPQRWKEKLDLINAAYPYRIICPPPAYIGGVAILSRRPFARGSEPRCFDRGSMAVADIDFGGRVISVAALHLGWPWPFDQPDQLAAIAPVLKSHLAYSALLAGDFNAVPWSQTVQHLAEVGDMQILRGIGPTWLAQGFPDLARRLVGFPIDNVLARGDVILAPPERLSDVGSDHLPVLIEFGLRTKAATPQRMEARL